MIGRALACVVTALTLLGTLAVPAAADTARDRQWYLADLRITEVHRITRGAGVTVALIDSGVDAKHRDLADAVSPGFNTRHDAWEDSTGREDTDGHGTNLAGIIAGRGHGSGDGVLGVAPAARILPISTPINERTSGSFMTEAVDFAIAHHAGVINMSFTRDDGATMHDAIRKARAAGIVLVAAAGNFAKSGRYPGRYPEVLTVSAYGKNHEISSFSVTGPQVDLAAPGDEMATTGIGATGYDITRGTSEAAAVVSGAAALVRARFPELSAAEVVHRLTATADDAGAPGRDDAYGHGRIDILRALTAEVTPQTAGGEARAANGTARDAPDVDGGDLPRAASPLLLGAIVGGLVVLAAVIVAVVVRRRRGV
jgi:type VII secretion-associated serine protease mycosin